jgi:hypothetical protein
MLPEPPEVEAPESPEEVSPAEVPVLCLLSVRTTGMTTAAAITTSANSEKMMIFLLRDVPVPTFWPWRVMLSDEV